MSALEVRPWRDSLDDEIEADQEYEALSFVGTCQTCGSYWDVRFQPVCPCGGEVL